jgi:hydrogenase maturation protease
VETATSLIAFDAARSGLDPGGISVHEGDDFERFVQRSGRSVHEVGLADLLDMARLAERLPARRVLIGIEPAEIGWGLDPTPAVAAALPTAVGIAREFVERWRPSLPAASHGEMAHAV